MRVFIFSTILCETFLIPCRNEREVMKNVHWFSCKVSLLLAGFNKNWIISINLWKIFKYQNPWKSV